MQVSDSSQQQGVQSVLSAAGRHHGWRNASNEQAERTCMSDVWSDMAWRLVKYNRVVRVELLQSAKNHGLDITGSGVVVLQVVDRRIQPICKQGAARKLCGAQRSEGHVSGERVVCGFVQGGS